MIPPGLYAHYKGGRYRVIGVATHSESEEQLVVYQSIQTDRLFVRPLQMFLNVTVDGKEIPRFLLIGG
jgi:hypothetical protein